MKDYRYKWNYSEDELPDGCCYDCRIKYSEFPDIHVPDELWVKITPRPFNNGHGGLLCPTCIANRLNHIGLWYKDDLYILTTK